MLAVNFYKYLLLGILIFLPNISFGKVTRAFVLSSKLPIFGMEDKALEKEDVCWQTLSQGTTNFDKPAKKPRLVFTLNHNLADVSSAKVLPGLRRHGITALFLVDSSSIVSNENILLNIVEQGHYVAVKNISENASKEELIRDLEVYYRVLEHLPLFIAQKSMITDPVEFPVRMMPIYVDEYDGRTILLEREGDFDDAISQVLESSSIVTLEKMMNLEQLKCNYQRLGCHCPETRNGIFSKWCTNIEDELTSRYISFAEYVSFEGSVTSQRVKDWLNDVHFFVQRNSEKLESLYETWRYADTVADSTSIIHLWPKRKIHPIHSVNSSCLRKFLQSHKQNYKIKDIIYDVHTLIDVIALLIIIIISLLRFRKNYFLIKKRD
ncbi:uncharacterized protein Gasu_04160 [Galdieria sulphuraria]|uniref:Uncharacterized protein n=1 Tax=Galdieria sulphuraria TaxID=130081 RepID=M2XQ24_GALSU|nr:uncharacterized protein Gasu_04160 [Galdieria sulphuraria]EME32322.1 hypothetical protein Gasu_04160 [Galdieria sulphuraria]|eukprot:XP_005708842.1 hypothetical protein Gasu_04160 [Galdieria sulphuraria]